MRRYDVVLLDAWNTLWHVSRPSYETWVDVLMYFGELRTEAEIKHAEERERSWLVPLWDRLESEGIPNSHSLIRNLWVRYDTGVLARLGIQATESEILERVLPVFEDSVQLYEETEAALSDLEAREYRLAIVSNGPYQETAAVRLGIRHHFREIIGSWHIGIRKPNPAIYHLALERLGVSAQQAAMAGDSREDDVEGARSVGIRGIHLVRNADTVVDGEAISDLQGLVEILETPDGSARS